MTYETLKARAGRKRAAVTREGNVFTLTDSVSGVTIGTAVGLLALEDKITWLDAV